MRKRTPAARKASAQCGSTGGGPTRDPSAGDSDDASALARDPSTSEGAARNTTAIDIAQRRRARCDRLRHRHLDALLVPRCTIPRCRCLASSARIVCARRSRPRPGRATGDPDESVELAETQHEARGSSASRAGSPRSGALPARSAPAHRTRRPARSARYALAGLNTRRRWPSGSVATNVWPKSIAVGFWRIGRPRLHQSA